MAQLADFEVTVTYEEIDETHVICHMRTLRFHRWKLYDLEEVARESGKSLEDVRTSILRGVKSWQQRIIISPK